MRNQLVKKLLQDGKMPASLEGALTTLMPKKVGKIECPENFRKNPSR